jgi:hypothetical protein
MVFDRSMHHSSMCTTHRISKSSLSWRPGEIAPRRYRVARCCSTRRNRAPAGYDRTVIGSVRAQELDFTRRRSHPFPRTNRAQQFGKLIFVIAGLITCRSVFPSGETGERNCAPICTRCARSVVKLAQWWLRLSPELAASAPFS